MHVGFQTRSSGRTQAAEGLFGGRRKDHASPKSQCGCYLHPSPYFFIHSLAIHISAPWATGYWICWIVADTGDRKAPCQELQCRRPLRETSHFRPAQAGSLSFKRLCRKKEKQKLLHENPSWQARPRASCLLQADCSQGEAVRGADSRRLHLKTLIQEAWLSLGDCIFNKTSPLWPGVGGKQLKAFHCVLVVGLEFRS